MKVTEIKFNRKVNLGNYESADLEMTAVLNEKDNVSECTSKLIGLVEAELGLSEPVKEEKPKKESKPKKEEVKEEKPKKEEKKKPKKETKKKPKVVKFDREVDHHKTELKNILNENVPNWKENKAKAKELSAKVLKGVDFIDDEGNILESFVETVVEFMSEGDDL